MERFENVGLVRPDSVLLRRGTLVADGDSLTFESKKGNLAMPKVRNVALMPQQALGRPPALTVEYGERAPYQSVQFLPFVSGYRMANASRVLEEKVRAALNVASIPEQERAEYQRWVATKKLAAEKRGRRQMAIGAVLAVVGIVVSLITYLNAASNLSGGTYIVLWGPVIFGLMLFFQGRKQSSSVMKLRGGVAYEKQGYDEEIAATARGEHLPESVAFEGEIEPRVTQGSDTEGRLAGWYEDPSGAFEFRYFDGESWTEYVATGGVEGTSPMAEDVPSGGAAGGRDSTERAER